MAKPHRVEELGKETYISLATYRRNGTAVLTPVWCALLDGKLYVVTDGTMAKVKRIRATGKIQVAPCNAWGGITGASVDGSGRVVSDKKVCTRAHAALHKKYGWQMWLLDARSRLFGRFERRAYLELSLDAAS